MQAGLGLIAIQKLIDQKPRTSFDLHIDPPDILTDDADRRQLQPAGEED